MYLVSNGEISLLLKIIKAYRVLLTVFALVAPASTNIPQDFGLSLCNLLEQIMLPYLIWKLWQSPFILGMEA